MRGKLMRTITVVISFVLAMTLLAGCSDKTAKTPAEGNDVNQTPTVAESAASDLSKEEITYPVKGGGKLTYWLKLDPKVSASSKTIADTEFAKELAKRTGIEIEWVHPTQGQEQQQLNLMIASGDMADIIDAPWGTWYPGGAEKALQDNVILPLNDLIEKYAPDYLKVLETDPEKNKQVRTDDGVLYGFACFRGDDINTVYVAPLLRGDWLKELGLSRPTTVAEYEEVLRAFKEKKGATVPFTITKNLDENFVAGALGFSLNWYIDDNGKVAYGRLHPNYKEYLTIMHRWYEEGLLDNNFATNDGDAIKANMLNSTSGLTIGFLSGNMGTWMNAMKDKDPNYELVASQYPTLNKGEKVKFAQKDWKFNGWSTAITTSCQNPELAAKFLNYGYTEEGEMLYNFGIEGVSYEMVNGYPTYTDAVMKHPTFSVAEALSVYTRTAYADGPFIQRKEYIEQVMQLPQQKEALQILIQADPYPNKYPPATTTPEEAQELATIESDINTYVDEMTLRFIIGTEPLSNFDKFVETVKSMNIDRAIEIRQKSVDRYNNRK
ncbi:extracellular solute-binding protein [Thermoclostridium stercorarium]|jgi:putative aldouronate transport system substrate-binding protein|uniref:extracellular solute-binding protein n=1 Tax=Thermoclostridium stercorarium TaxID=1510 RepID=UPI000A83A148|nr:extracellular solute-binding protein [Thermoclostridium stercorarium]